MNHNYQFKWLNNPLPSLSESVYNSGIYKCDEPPLSISKVDNQVPFVNSQNKEEITKKKFKLQIPIFPPFQSQNRNPPPPQIKDQPNSPRSIHLEEPKIREVKTNSIKEVIFSN
jgi:hypothetical protein